MKARWLDDDRLLVPMRAEGPDGTMGDGMVEIGPDHPDYGAWLPHIEESGARRTGYPAGRGAGSGPGAR